MSLRRKISGLFLCLVYSGMSACNILSNTLRTRKSRGKGGWGKPYIHQLPPLSLANRQVEFRSQFQMGAFIPKLMKLANWRLGLCCAVFVLAGYANGMPLLVGSRMPHLAPTRRHGRHVGTRAATSTDAARQIDTREKESHGGSAGGKLLIKVTLYC